MFEKMYTKTSNQLQVLNVKRRKQVSQTFRSFVEQNVVYHFGVY